MDSKSNETLKNLNNYEDVQLLKPFLKWVGGKSQIINKVLGEFPVKIKSYHEVFLGGGSVLLALLTYRKAGLISVDKIYAYDINEPLIYVYKNLQENYKELYKALMDIIKEYKSIKGEEINRNPSDLNEAKTSQESYYYFLRKKYNSLSNDEKKTVLGSGLFIFLNKTCFRGLFRIGPNGFNVPYGHYKNPEIINEKHLQEIHELIQGVHFIHSHFNDSLDKVEEKDFVYLDPPYVPEKTTSFVKYNEGGFDSSQHQKLFERLNKLKCKFLLSNSSVDLVKESFKDSRFKIENILCKRAINSKKPGSTTNEVLIGNY